MNVEFLSKGELDNFLRTTGYSGGVLSRLTNLMNSQLWNNLPSIIEGMYVCVDVPSNYHGGGYRLFGAVDEVVYDPDGKNSYSLLVHEVKPNPLIVEESFERWWNSVEGKDKNGYLMDKESAKEGYNAAIAMNNV